MNIEEEKYIRSTFRSLHKSINNINNADNESVKKELRQLLIELNCLEDFIVPISNSHLTQDMIDHYNKNKVKLEDIE